MPEENYWGGSGFEKDAPKASKPRKKGKSAVASRAAPSPVPEGDVPRWQQMYHRVILAAGGVGALIGAVIVLAGIAKEGLPEQWIGRRLMGAAMLAGMGGIALAAVFGVIAPSSFLRGPIGRKWLSRVGTTNVVAARVICLMAAVGGIVGFTMLAIYAL
jgi:hypothetical protein